MWSLELTGTRRIAIAIFLIEEAFEGVENAIGTRVDGDRRQITPKNDPVSVDHEEGSFAHPVLLAIGPVFLCDRSLGMEIRKQREMDMVVSRICLVAPGNID